VKISLFYRFYYVFAVSGGFFGYVGLVRRLVGWITEITLYK
jgi:hypothetical protein